MSSGNVIQINTADLSPSEIYKLLIGIIAPRPIAFVSTLNSAGQGNLAPFSFFNGVCSNPPSLMISIARKSDGSKKDTLINIEQTGQFVVNSANSWFLEQLVGCGAEYPYGENEMSAVGLTPIESKLVKPQRVKEAAVQMECELLQAVQIGDGSAGSSTVVFGKILLIHLEKSIYVDGKIEYSSYQPIGRIGGIKYTALGEITSRQIPSLDHKSIP